MSKVQKENQKLKNREWSEKIELSKLSGKSAQAWCLENQVVYTITAKRAHPFN